jgi:hypothetical protein
VDKSVLNAIISYMKNNFDLTISFDKAEYLNPQLYMLVDTLKDNIPSNTILHITTNRSKDDSIIQYITESINTKVYYKEPFKDLKSRCQYMFHCFEIETNKPWVVKLESDFLILKHLSCLDTILKDDLDIVVEPENRKIFDDTTANRLWRIIYKAMDIEMPKFFLQFRENKERGLPLFGTGLICIKSEHIKKLNERWIPLTKICEQWIDYNIHPNEMAFTGIILDEGWNWAVYNDKYKFNPIGHFRKGEFPSTDLIDNCKLPDDTIILDYHRFPWLLHIAKYNENIRNIVQRNKQFIPHDIWDMSFKTFQEGKYEIS